MLESKFQGQLIRDIREMFPGSLVTKLSGHIQGLPDLLILFNDRWAVLEVKQSATADTQPNQPYYVNMLDQMSFAAFIYPENKEEVLRGLKEALQPRRKARSPEPK